MATGKYHGWEGRKEGGGLQTLQHEGLATQSWEGKSRNVFPQAFQPTFSAPDNAVSPHVMQYHDKSRQEVIYMCTPGTTMDCVPSSKI